MNSARCGRFSTSTPSRSAANRRPMATACGYSRRTTRGGSQWKRPPTSPERKNTDSLMAETLTVRAGREGERSASAWLASRAAAHGVPDAEIRRLDQCLDEALANAIQHGGGEAVASPLQLQFEVRR